jgi:CubicO group peptidase (beta-lactamase class C family)
VTAHRRALATIVVAALLAVRAPVRADDLSVSFFGDYVESLRRQAGIPGIAAVIDGATDITWSRGFGSQNLEKSIAARTDAPFELDGLTQMFTASIVLRCVEEGQLALTDRIGQYDPSNPEPNATLADILSHTTAGPAGAVFDSRHDRLKPLALAVQACPGKSFRASVADWLDRLAMIGSVPGADVVSLSPPDPAFSTDAIARYGGLLAQLAVPYAVDRSGHAAPSQYSATSLTASSGLISTANDLARFDVAIRRGAVLQPDTLALAWRAPAGASGQTLPHGLGWFVQTYNGFKVVWQFGVSDNASSSLVIIVPSRSIALVLLANSDGLVNPFALSAGDVTASPFGRVFLGTFVR